MMGKGGERGYVEEKFMSRSGKQERSCRNMEMLERTITTCSMGRPVSIYSQALKVLSLNLPSGVGDAGASNSTVSVHTHENKQRNRLKKLQLLGRAEKEEIRKNGNCEIKGARFWSYVEDYFREVTSDDIQMLLPTTNLNEALDFQDASLLMPPLGGLFQKGLSEEDEDAKDTSPLTEPTHVGAKRKRPTGRYTKKRRKPLSYYSEVVTTVISPPDNDDDDELCHVCNGGESYEKNQILFCDSCNIAVHQECYGVKVVPKRQWLCSWCQYQKFSVSRKIRKLRDTSLGEDGADKSQDHLWDCALCPVKGGALKPIAQTDHDLGHLRTDNTRFAHLFCSQWIPETYIQDTKSMEPIRNVEAVREERRKLLCSICRVKHGPCIQCSHGMCATAFHPLCAREAKFRMEVCSKNDADEVDLQAFCQKHSVRINKTSAYKSIESGTTEVTVQDVSFDGVVGSAPKSKQRPLKKEEPTESVVGRYHSAHGRAVSEEAIGGFITPTGGGKNLRQMLNGRGTRSEESNSATETSGGNSQTVTCSGVGSAISSSNNAALVDEVDMNYMIQDLQAHLKMAMQQLQISKTDLAGQIGASSDALLSWLLNKKQIDRMVTEKVKEWLSNHAGLSNVSGTMNKFFDERSWFVKDFRSLPKATKVGLRKRQKCEGKPSGCLGKSIGKGSPKMDKLIMQEAVLVHQKEGEMTPQMSSLAEGDENAAHIENSAHSQKDETSVASVCLESEFNSNNQRTHHGLSKEARQPLMNCGLEKIGSQTLKLETEGCATSSYSDSLPPKNERNISDRGKEEYSTDETGTIKWPQVSYQCDSAKRDRVTRGRNLVLFPKCVVDGPFFAPGHELAPSIAASRLAVMHCHQEFMDNRQLGYCEELNLVPASRGNLITGPNAFTKGAINPSINKLIQNQLTVPPCSAQRNFVATSLSIEKGADQELANSIEAQWKQLEEARRSGLLEDLPSDEVEEELICLQSSLVTHARQNQQYCGNLVLNVITSVWEERQAFRKRLEDLLLVHKYLKEVREARKKSRKDRHIKEAQADLVATTAATVSSPRFGTTRRGDGPSVLDFEIKPTSMGGSLCIDDAGPSSSTGFSIPISSPVVSRPSKLNVAMGCPGSSSSFPSQQQEATTRPIHMIPSKDERQMLQNLVLSDELPLCDICFKKEVPVASKIIVCHQCKVAVHADCYGVSRNVLSPWYCEACLEFLQQQQCIAAQGDISKGAVQCVLCGRQSGAFKRSSSSGWVHVFCAQWVPGSIIGKDQSSYVEHLESIPVERLSSCCSFCCVQQGVSFRCNFGHCNAAFHAMCARDAGLYISLKAKPGGGILYRGYCQRHSSQQKEKEHSKPSGSINDISTLMQKRVELERVRLLCERVIKRERLKREVLNCSRDCYTSHMKAIAIVASRLSSHDNSKTSAGISEFGREFPSASGNVEPDKYSRDADNQRQSSIKSNSLLNPSASLDDGRSSDGICTDDPSLLSSPEAGEGLAELKAEDKAWPNNCKKGEVVMTPTEASVQNKKLPKGYAYVPAGSIVEGRVSVLHPDIL